MPTVSRILITGGAGYVGSVLTRDLLEQGKEVVVADALLFGGESLLDLLSHPRFEFVHADLTREQDVHSLFEARRFDAVVHLASLVGDPACKAEPELAQMTIWDGSRRLFDHCESYGVSRFIFASTCSNYGKMAAADSVNEDAPLRPVSLYAELKVRFEQYLAARDTPVDYTILRFATVYGLSLRPRFDLTINEFARDALIKGALEIYGPEFWRPYCHVRDIAGAVSLVLDASPAAVSHRVFNVGSNDQNYQKKTIAARLAEELPVKIVNVEKDEDPRDYRVNFDRISALGFTPRVSLSDGIHEIVRAIRSGLIGDPYSVRYRNC